MIQQNHLYRFGLFLILLVGTSSCHHKITSIKDLTYKDYYRMFVKYDTERAPIDPDTIYAITFERSKYGGEGYDYEEGLALIHQFKNLLEMKFSKPHSIWSSSYEQKILDSIDFTKLPNLKKITGVRRYSQHQINRIAQSTSIQELEILGADLDSIPSCFCKNQNLKKIKIIVVKKIPECIKKMDIDFLHFGARSKGGGRFERLNIGLNKAIRKLLKDTTKIDYNDEQTQFGNLYPLEIKSLDSLVYETSRGDSLPPNIKALKNLRYLKIIGEMHSIPEEINALSNLEVLEIEGSTKGVDNPICRMPKSFKGLQKLKVFSMDDYVVDRFPPLYDIPGLEHILITRVEGIDSFPDAIEKLTNLQTFGYSEDGYINFRDQNGLKEHKTLEQYITEMGSEKVLKKLNYVDGFYKAYTLYIGSKPLPYITTNPTLNYISPNIGKLSNLNFFSLSNVKITHLPESMSNLTNLKHFSITNSFLKSLPKNFNNLNPVIINLENNQLTHLPSVSPPGKYGHAKLRKNQLSDQQKREFLGTKEQIKQNCAFFDDNYGNREVMRKVHRASEDYLEYKLFGRNKKFVKEYNLD